MAIEPSNKRERQLWNRGAAMARAKMKKKARNVKDDGALLAGSFFGQKFLGGMPTPLLPTIPLAYSLLGANFLFGIGGDGLGRQMIMGYAAGELGVRGRAQATNVLSGLFGGTSG